MGTQGPVDTVWREFMVEVLRHMPQQPHSFWEAGAPLCDLRDARGHETSVPLGKQSSPVPPLQPRLLAEPANVPVRLRLVQS